MVLLLGMFLGLLVTALGGILIFAGVVFLPAASSWWGDLPYLLLFAGGIIAAIGVTMIRNVNRRSKN